MEKSAKYNIRYRCHCTQGQLNLLVHSSMQFSVTSLLHHPLIHAFLNIHQSIITVHPPRIKSYRRWRSVIHLSVSQSISHPSIQSRSAVWLKQPVWSGHVSNEEEETDSQKTTSHGPHIIPLWLTSWLLSSFCLHWPVSLFSQPPLFKLLTHLFTESGLQPLQGHKLVQMTVVPFPLSLSGVHSQFSEQQSWEIMGAKLHSYCWQIRDYVCVVANKYFWESSLAGWEHNDFVYLWQFKSLMSLMILCYILGLIPSPGLQM